MLLPSATAFVTLPPRPAAFHRAAKAAAKVMPSPSCLYYDIQRDPPNENVWSVLANTERWIASTLKSAEPTASTSNNNNNNNNPLSRKEVSYVCETSQDPAMILANIFRKLKEARQLGETHGQEQEELVMESSKSSSGGKYSMEDGGGFVCGTKSQKSIPCHYYCYCCLYIPNFPPNRTFIIGPLAENHVRATLRQTQVLVIPANEDIQDFQVFDQLVTAINEARRAARDYVTDHSLERLDDKLYGGGGGAHPDDDDKEWVYVRNTQCIVKK